MHSGTFSQLSFKLTSCGMKPKSEDTHEVKLKKQSKQNYSNFRRSEFFVNHFCRQKDICFSFSWANLGAHRAHNCVLLTFAMYQGLGSWVAHFLIFIPDLALLPL